MSQLPSDLPQLPKWPFLCADLVLLATAAAVTWGSSGPLGGGTLVTVMILVGLAAILCAIPFVTDYARSQDQSLDERQRSLEALAKSITNSNEQLGIAVQSLGRLETQRFDSSLETLRVAIEDLARLEGACRKDAEHALARFSELESSAAKASARSSAAMEQSLVLSSESLAASLLSVRSAMDALVADAQAKFAAQIHSRVSETSVAVEGVLSAYSVRMDELASRFDARVAASLSLLDEKVASLKLLAGQIGTVTQAAVLTGDSRTVLEPESSSSAPSPDETASPVIITATPTPIPSSPLAETLAPESALASSLQAIPEAQRELPVAELPSLPAVPLPSVTVRQPRRKPEPVPEAQVMDLFNEHFSLDESHSGEPLVSKSVSADGATRLIITAYIGIGNKLFIRGDGPGLTWDRGVPLVFVSIGKWRWETLEAETPFRFRLFKNDAMECTSLGEQTVNAGQQFEATASF